MDGLPVGIYDRLLDHQLAALLRRHPELRSVFGKLDPEEEPSRYAAFVARVVERVLRLEPDPAKRLGLCNEVIGQLGRHSTPAEAEALQLVEAPRPRLLEITPSHLGEGKIARPQTPLVGSSLFTGSPSDPQLAQELVAEMGSADAVDILLSFIKWSGLKLLLRAFEDLALRSVPVRIITTSYMGASDARAVEWLAGQPNVEIRVSYDTERTRLHAKAYHFRRASGFSTAYIGSANMSDAAMTSGLEWNLKVTAQDMPHIIEKFAAEFETYWNSREFVPLDPAQPGVLREALRRAQTRQQLSPVFFDLRPHAFQERILDALENERRVHGQTRNLVVAATGTGKTVVAAFDYQRFLGERQGAARLLFVAHRREILEQALVTFRAVLRQPDFGDLLVGPHEAARFDHLFCSVDLLRSRRLWEQLGSRFYDYIVVDEVHHGPSASYRPVFDSFAPGILLGLTATPERMDGASVAADFGHRFAAEIRLPEALEQKLLCPFHYFGVADPVSLSADRFWRNGRYDAGALEEAYTDVNSLALQRLEVVVASLRRYEPDLEQVHGIGFCVSIRHAEFMAARFSERGIPSAVLVGETPQAERVSRLNDFRCGRLRFLFTRDVLNEGLDIPEINTVLFLRPTESLTVFLQQLGRGLRHAPGKDCLTVLDLVGQAHRRYRVDRKLKALLSGQRYHILREVEQGFPHLPAGCSIQLDRVATEYVLANLKENLRHLAAQVTDHLESFEQDSGLPLTFGNFVTYHDYLPESLLSRRTWSEWKSSARRANPPRDPDLTLLRGALLSVAQTRGPAEIRRLQAVVGRLRAGATADALIAAGTDGPGIQVHYRLWGKPGKDLGLPSLEASFERAARNPTVLQDLEEILAWAGDRSRAGGAELHLPFPCPLELHATYGNDEIKAALGGATLESAGMTGVGCIHLRRLRTIVALVTFQKVEREFSPTTMYQDYPISRTLMHWESQSTTSQESELGQNMIHHQDRGYTMLFFARSRKREDGLTAPFLFLGPATLETAESERPIRMVWRLAHPMPVELFEENRRGG